MQINLVDRGHNKEIFMIDDVKEWQWAKQFIEYMRAMALDKDELTQYMNYLAGCMNAFHTAKKNGVPPPPPRWWENWARDETKEAL